MNPKNEKDSARLKTSLEASYKKLKPFRENNIEAVRQYVGSHYSNDGADDKVPINLLELAINIYIRQLAARAPNVLVTTPYSGRMPGTMNLKPYAANLEKLALPSAELVIEAAKAVCYK